MSEGRIEGKRERVGWAINSQKLSKAFMVYWKRRNSGGREENQIKFFSLLEDYFHAFNEANNRNQFVSTCCRSHGNRKSLITEFSEFIYIWRRWRRAEIAIKTINGILIESSHQAAAAHIYKFSDLWTWLEVAILEQRRRGSETRRFFCRRRAGSGFVSLALESWDKLKATISGLFTLIRLSLC